jgi:beta-galactosidase
MSTKNVKPFRNIVLIVIAFVSFCLSADGRADKSLPIKKNSFATEILFNTGWKFFRVDSGQTEPKDAMKPNCDESAWESVTLPHTVRIEAPENATHPFLGTAWYRHTITVKPEWDNKHVSLFFEGAMQVAEVWVNGELVARHNGGYLPFTIELSKALAKQGKAVIAVRVDNTHKPLIPPGKPNNKIDFCYFGGLYRNVHLRVTDPVHLTDAVTAGKIAGGGVFARYENVSETSADILVSAQVKNDGIMPANTGIRFILRDVKGNEVASTSIAPKMLTPNTDQIVDAKLKVKSPKLWNPDSPYRYTLITEVICDGKVVNTNETRIGIRSIAFDNAGFHLNGKPFVLRGANRHQDYPWLGNAVPDNAGYRDIRLLKEAGYNFLRLAHYPQSPAIMDACDELGVMVSVCTPGWQYFNDDEVFKNNGRQNIREMVRWHRNHPSAIMWEVTLNETYGHDEFYAECAKIVHEEYPGNQSLTSGDAYGSKSAGYLDIPYPVWTHDHNEANSSAKWTKAFIREYGDYHFGGHYSTSRVPLGAGEEALLLQAWNHQWNHNENRSKSWFAGDCLWAGIDDASGFGTPDRLIAYWGPLDYNRLPKFSYRFFQSQRSSSVTPLGVGAGPVTFIANYWTIRKSPVKVVVYSNGDEVELFLNGKSIGRRKPDSGPNSKYGEWHPDADVVYMVNGGENMQDRRKTAEQVAAHTAEEKQDKHEKVMFDGGNARYIDHAPFTFPGISYVSGELRAVSYRNGKAISEFTRCTPGKPAAIRLEVAENGKPLIADGNDAVFIRAYVVDAKGTVIPDLSSSITFKIEGAARLISHTTAKTEEGIATALIASSNAPGVIRITAKSNNLPLASLQYKTHP